MRNFASTLVKFSKLSHIQTTIWRPPKMAPPPHCRVSGALCYATEACLPRLLQLDFLISPAKLDFFNSPAKLDFLISPAKLDFLISPATAGLFY